MFIAALFTTAKTWKQPKCSSTDDWIKKIWYNTTQQQKSQQPNGKICKRPEETFFQGRCTDGQQAHEKMLNIAGYKRNANQKTTTRYHLTSVRMAIYK